MSSEAPKRSGTGGLGWYRGACALLASFLTAMLAPPEAQAREPFADWRVCSERLAAEPDSALAVEARRDCVIAVADTYLQWAGGTLAAEALPLSDDFRRRRLGTSREAATTDREAFLADRRPELIASVTAQEWFVDGDTAWAIFTVTLKAQQSTHWVAERFTLTRGKISDILALPSVIKP